MQKNFSVGAKNIMTSDNTANVASNTETTPRVQPIDQSGDEDA